MCSDGYVRNVGHDYGWGFFCIFGCVHYGYASEQDADYALLQHDCNRRVFA